MNLLFIALLLSNHAFAGTDFLAEQTLKIESTRSSEVLTKALSDPKAVFTHFAIALDSSTTIVRPLVISGTSAKPIIQVSLKKCVAFVCKTVDLDMAVTVQEGKGECERTFKMTGDLSRSSENLRNMYDRLDVMLCYTSAANGTGSLKLSGFVNQGAHYQSGFVQQEVMKLMRLQVAPIVKAIQLTLKEKE